MRGSSKTNHWTTTINVVNNMLHFLVRKILETQKYYKQIRVFENFQTGNM